VKVKNLLGRQVLPFFLCLVVVGVLLFLGQLIGTSSTDFRGQVEDYFLSAFFYYNSLAIYLFVLVLALFSFRNLYNFKILLAGFLFLMTGIFSLFYFTNVAEKSDNSHFLVYLFYSADLLVVGLVPSYLPRVSTQIFLGIFILLKGFLIVGSPPLLDALDVTLSDRQQLTGAILMINAIVTAVSIRRSWRRGDFYGGAIAGLALVFTVSYFAQAYLLKTIGMQGSKDPFLQGELLEILLTQAVPVILTIFVIANWVISLSHRASYDPLMSIYNRRYCDGIIEGRSQSLGTQFCVAILDIDNFKEINDIHGHTLGDRVLHQLGLKIRDMALPRGVTCRYGGEEIVIFFPNTGIDYARKVVHEIVVSISEFKIWLDMNEPKQSVQVTVSGGVAAGEKGKDQARQVLEAADQALLLSKQAGRNQVTVSG